MVDNHDPNAIAAVIGQSTPTGVAPRNADISGEGPVRAFDLTLATRPKGRRLGTGLPRG